MYNYIDEVQSVPGFQFYSIQNLWVLKETDLISFLLFCVWGVGWRELGNICCDQLPVTIKCIQQCNLPTRHQYNISPSIYYMHTVNTDQLSSLSCVHDLHVMYQTMDQQHGQCMTQALCLHQAVNIYRSRHVTHANNRVHDMYIS
jgi:hypothetical protein